MGVLEVGHRYALEQLVEEAGIGSWDALAPPQILGVHRKIKSRLGVSLLDYQEDDVIREYNEEGAEGTATEEGAKVQVLVTSNPDIEIHVMEYRNPDLGTRYDLVRVENINFKK